MIARGLRNLPIGSTPRNGWPWVFDLATSQSDASKDLEWPRITVVTPSFNQAKFLEETIRSVLLQDYPNLEYIVIDGGSTDGSIAIIQKYAPWITHWESHSDHGQSEAINRGLRAATGDIQCWINSDDYLAPGALADVAKTFLTDPKTDWVIGAATLLHSENQTAIRSARRLSKLELMNWTECNWFCQQATFWRRSLLLKAGFLNESLHFVMDWELWLRFYAISLPRILDQPLAYYRFHKDAKCVATPNKLLEEDIRLTLSIIDAPETSILAGYRDAARDRLKGLLSRAYRTQEERRPSLNYFGSFELLSEVARRSVQRFIPTRSRRIL